MIIDAQMVEEIAEGQHPALEEQLVQIARRDPQSLKDVVVKPPRYSASSIQSFADCESGVYRIVCVPTGRQYVGQSENVTKRLRTHRLRLEQGRHENPKLQNAWDKHGSASFVFEPLLFDEAQHLDALESILLATLSDRDFNVALAPSAPMRGRHHSESTRKQMSQAHTGKKKTEEHKARIAAAHTGLRPSGETKAKIAAALRGRKASVEHRAKIGAASLRYWSEHSLTEEQRAARAVSFHMRGKYGTVSRFKGVTRNYKRWRARITVDGRRIGLGNFATQEEAARAFDDAARRYFGNAVTTNKDLGLL